MHHFEVDMFPNKSNNSTSIDGCPAGAGGESRAVGGQQFDMLAGFNGLDANLNLLAAAHVAAVASEYAPAHHQPAFLPVRDTKWLTLSVCPHFYHQQQQNPASKPGGEDDPALMCDSKTCYLAHPEEHVKIDEDFKVTVCFDFIKRDKCSYPSCKYFHPPAHLAEFVLRQGHQSKRVIHATTASPSHQAYLLSTMLQQHHHHHQVQKETELKAATLPNEKSSPTTVMNGAGGILINSQSFNPGLMAGAPPELNLNPAAAVSGSIWVTGSVAGAAAAKRPTYSATQVGADYHHATGALSTVAPGNEEYLGVDATQNSSSGCSSKSSTSGCSVANSPQQQQAATENALRMMRSPPGQQAAMPAAGNNLWAVAEQQQQQQQQQQAQQAMDLGLFHAHQHQLLSAAHSHHTHQNAQTAANWGLTGASGLDPTTQHLLTAAALAGTPGHAHHQHQQPGTAGPQQPHLLSVYLRNQLAPGPQHQHQQQTLLAAASAANSGFVSPVQTAAANPYQTAAIANLLQSAAVAASPQAAFSTPAGAQQTNASQQLPASALSPQAMAISMYYLQQMNLENAYNMHLQGMGLTLGGTIQNPITNVAYMNEKGHLLESLPICRDFKAGKCHRHSECRYVHLIDDNVEVNQGRVTICRDAAKGRCTRNPCKYFHIPPIAISTSRSLAYANNQAASTAAYLNAALGAGSVAGSSGHGTPTPMLSYCDPTSLGM